MRQIIGWKPSTDPKADELRNKNLNQSDGETSAMPGADSSGENDQDSIVNELLDSLEAEINAIIGNYLDDGGEEEEETDDE